MFDEALKTFEIFSLSHLIADLVVVAIIVLLFWLRPKLQDHPGLDRILRYSMAFLMLAMHLIFELWRVSKGPIQWYDFLPIGVCHLSMVLTSICLILNSEKIFQFIFPWAIGGAILSLVIADLEYEFPHFRYFHYFGNHGMFLIANIYLALIRRFTLSYKNILFSSLALFVFAVPMIWINESLGTNYLFMGELPEPAQPLFGWMGEPWWRLGFILAIFALFNLNYLFYRGLHKLAVLTKKE